MRKIKSNLKIVPATHDKFGACWVIKDAGVVVGTFINKQMAEKRKAEMERLLTESFLLEKTKTQELKIED